MQFFDCFRVEIEMFGHSPTSFTRLSSPLYSFTNSVLINHQILAKYQIMLSTICSFSIYIKIVHDNRIKLY